MEDWDGSKGNFRPDAWVVATGRVRRKTQADRGRVEKLYRAGRARRDHRATSGASIRPAGDPPTKHKRNSAYVPRFGERGTHAIPRIHRYDHGGDPQGDPSRRCCAGVRALAAGTGAKVANRVTEPIGYRQL